MASGRRAAPPPSQPPAKVICAVSAILRGKEWKETMEGGRGGGGDGKPDTRAGLVAEHGLLSVTMSQIAEATGIGRATLYKYFSDVEAILFAWHERQIAGHLAYLAEIGHQPGAAGERLKAVLEAYAFHAHDSRGHHDTDLPTLPHLPNHVPPPH